MRKVQEALLRTAPGESVAYRTDSLLDKAATERLSQKVLQCPRGRTHPTLAGRVNMNEKATAAAASRRRFLKQVGATAGVVLSHALLAAPKAVGANDRVRLGLIGAGDRGTEILRAALRCPNTEAAAAADVFTHRLDAIKRLAPDLKTHTDFRHLLDDKSIDAVLIATPQHQHALNFVPALQAGKDVYQEKTMAFNPDHARRMRRAYEGSGRVVQIGIQSTSGPGFAEARRLATPERMGTITLIHTHHYRNAPYGGWLRDVPADCDPRHVDWPAFQGEARPQGFSADRVVNEVRTGFVFLLFDPWLTGRGGGGDRGCRGAPRSSAPAGRPRSAPPPAPAGSPPRPPLGPTTCPSPSPGR
jgi:Oxidoreductase family, NAD-binding Rossmann fold